MNADERRGGTEGAGSEANRAERERDAAGRKPGSEQENEPQSGRATGDAAKRGQGGAEAPGAKPAAGREANTGNARAGGEKDVSGANDTGDANERRGDRSGNR